MGKLRGLDVLCSGLGVGFMLLPLLGTIGIPGSTLFPVPTFPNNLLLWLFVAYMLAGLGWLWLQKTRSPRMIHEMQLSIDEIHLKFSDVKNIS